MLQEADRRAVEEERRAADLNCVLDAGIGALRSRFPDPLRKNDMWHDKRIKDQASNDWVAALRSAEEICAAAKRRVVKLAKELIKKGSSTSMITNCTPPGRRSRRGRGSGNGRRGRDGGRDSGRGPPGRWGGRHRGPPGGSVRGSGGRGHGREGGRQGRGWGRGGGGRRYCDRDSRIIVLDDDSPSAAYGVAAPCAVAAAAASQRECHRHRPSRRRRPGHRRQ